jgi:hypothetical protein
MSHGREIGPVGSDLNAPANSGVDAPGPWLRGGSEKQPATGPDRGEVEAHPPLRQTQPFWKLEVRVPEVASAASLVFVISAALTLAATAALAQESVTVTLPLAYYSATEAYRLS